MSVTTLSPAVIRVSGAIETVFSNVEKYTDHPVNKKSQTAIARLVETRLDLNNETSIGMLVDLSAFHGVSQMARLGRQIDEHGLPAVHLAVDYLYECGERGQANDKTVELVGGLGLPRRYMTGMDSVDKVAALINDLSVITGAAIESSDHLSDLVAELGGLSVALDMNSIQLEQAVAAEFVLSGADEAAEDDDSVANA